ncbi:PAS domain-containing protein [Luteolibacter flavescens]|uniref:histidine kinase n=1 Tax=Luteolibacter flavescens TaxID=1859460 RepID=A0ABT3FRQ7_9BACT|nr:PAS domain-containing protein [Luteolibacter flavescens]MCW1885655.1 PAS domain-containing protein [Luteolibacter flavescens]
MRRSGALVILAGIFILLGTSWLVIEESDLITRVAASAVILLATGLLIGRLRTIPEATSASDRLAEINRRLEDELVQMREQHRQLDHYFEMLMANVPANIYFKDRESRFLRVNQSMATYVRKGHPRDLIGKNDHDLFDREHADDARADELRIINTGVPVNGLVEHEVFPDGSVGWVLTNKMPFRDREGNIIGTFGMSSDVSELVNAKQELERERYLLRSLIDAFPDKIFARDLQRQYLVVNRAMAEWVGASSPEEMIGKTPAHYFPETIVKEGEAEDQSIIENRLGVINREWDLEWKPGDVHHFVTTKVPLFDAEGQIWGFVGMDRDVTEQRRAQLEVIQAEQRMQAIIDNSPAVISMKDLEGRYLMVNRGFEDLFGLARKDVLGFTDHQLIADKSAADKFRKHDILIAEGGEALQMDEELYVDNEPRTYVAVKFPLRDLNGQIQSIGAISTDITDRKAAEQAMHVLNQDLVKANEDLKRAQEQLIQAEKMESVGRLAAGVAHEVKNPLAMIGMGIELLARRIPAEDTQAQETIERMKRGIDRAKKIVKGLVDYSSARKLSVEPKDISEVIGDSLALVEYPLRQAKVKLETEIQPALPRVSVDATKMEQVMVNLMINAMHAMPDGGTLTVRAFSRALSGVRRDVGVRTAGHLREGDRVVRIEVDDSGSGIDEANMSKIFDPFFTTKATGQGTGLGLAVCRKIVELHNGMLELENLPGGGVRASITLKT